MSSLIRRIEKKIVKSMGVRRNVLGFIVDGSDRIVGSRGGKSWPKFADFKAFQDQNDA